MWSKGLKPMIYDCELQLEKQSTFAIRGGLTKCDKDSS